MRGERSYSDTVEERSPLLQHYAAYMNQQSPNGNAIDHHNRTLSRQANRTSRIPSLCMLALSSAAGTSPTSML
jgi:hypothetical protein